MSTAVSRIVIDQTGAAFSEQVTKTAIPNIAHHLRKLSLNSSIRLPALTPDTWMTYNGKFFTAFRRILKLQIHCVWKPEEVEDSTGRILSIIRPSFNAEPSRGALCERDFYWDVPTDMILLFVVAKLTSSSTVLANAGGADMNVEINRVPDLKCGLLAVDKATGRLYRLPLPNTHDNAALCTGHLHAATAGAWTQFRGIFASWSENQWNHDLISATRGNHRLMFQVDATTLKAIPSKQPWQELCFPVAPNWVDKDSLNAGLEGLCEPIKDH